MLVAGLSFLAFNLAVGLFAAAVVYLFPGATLEPILHFDGLSDLGDGMQYGECQECKLAAMEGLMVRGGGQGHGPRLFFELIAVAIHHISER